MLTNIAFQVQRESHVIRDLGLDSLDHVEIVMMLEDEFNMEISENESDKLLVVEDMIQFVVNYLQNKPNQLKCPSIEHKPGMN